MKKLTLGRLGSAIGRNVSRRGATSEDLQFMTKEANAKYADAYNWLRQSGFGGKYSVDMVSSFSTVGSAFHVVLTFIIDDIADAVLQQQIDDNVSYLKPYKG